MRILVSGASGLVGASLVPLLRRQGHEVLLLVRSPSAAAPGAVFWDPSAAKLDLRSVEGCDAAIHLAGENIAGGRWTAERKRQILESRRKGTRLLAEGLGRLARPPKVLISASAIGYYGNRGAETLRENSRPGSDFLSEVCVAWEEATRPAWEGGIRVVNPRIGVVLSTAGGALARMLPPFRLGLGGKIGSGNQYMSWISMDDLVGVICYCMETEALVGPVNAVSPHPVTNREFSRALADALSRPSVFPLPGFLARWLLGEMADALLLASARVEPARLLAAGYGFQHPELEVALRHVLRP